MHPGVRLERVMGAAIGVAVLVLVFLVPFSSTIAVLPGSPDTLYNVFHFFVGNLGSVLNLASSTLELIAFLYILGTILLLVEGILGSFPLVSGMLGICGMAMMTVGGLASPQYTPYPVTYGPAFYLLWAFSLAQPVVWFVSRRVAPESKQSSSVMPPSPAV